MRLITGITLPCVTASPPSTSYSPSPPPFPSPEGEGGRGGARGGREGDGEGGGGGGGGGGAGGEDAALWAVVVREVRDVCERLQRRYPL
jgi:hypothetical protein